MQRKSTIEFQETGKEIAGTSSPIFLPETMRVFTILQPCAEAMLHQVDGLPLKTWENRSKPAPAELVPGEWIALHAGQRPWEGADLIRKLWPECPEYSQIKWGAILGAWRYDGCMSVERVTRDKQWALGPYCYRVGASIRLPNPILWAGAQGWRFLPPQITRDIRTEIVKAGHELHPWRRVRGSEWDDTSDLLDLAFKHE